MGAKESSCDVPPVGWICTRPRGHDGPCAAWPKDGAGAWRREANTKWDLRFLDVAKLISSWSKDPSTKVGCVVVGPHREIRSTGFNGFPRGVEDTDARLNDRETKYPLIVHAEENTVAQAARIGQSLHGCAAYTTSPTCPRCARLLIQAGISRVVYPDKPVVPGSWEDRAAAEIQIAKDMLVEASVVVTAV